MLFMEIMAIHCETFTKHINVLCDQIVEFL
jgi:hypothetical protein